MSSAFKCDRCSDFFESTPVQSPIELTCSGAAAFASNTVKHLCPQCKNEFDRWWKTFARSMPDGRIRVSS